MKAGDSGTEEAAYPRPGTNNANSATTLGLDHKGFDQMKVMEPRDLLHRMSKTEFAMFLRQVRLTPESYI